MYSIQWKLFKRKRNTKVNFFTEHVSSPFGNTTEAAKKIDVCTIRWRDEPMFSQSRSMLFRVTLGLAASLLTAAGGSRVYRNVTFRIHSFDPPQRWTLSDQASYPTLLCTYFHPDGGRISLVAEPATPDITPAIVEKQSEDALAKQGFSRIVKKMDAFGRLRVDADGGKGKILKQAYIVEGPFAYVLSVSGPKTLANEWSHDFEDALRTLVFEHVAAEATSTPGDNGAVEVARPAVDAAAQ
jgi:hypothetical protein